MSFVGHSGVSIDQKRRIAVPAKYREELVRSCGNKLVCTIGQSNWLFLRLFPRPRWDLLEQEFSTGLLGNGENDEVERFLMAMAEDVFVDANHRLLLPQHLVDRVGLQKKAVLIGRGNHFELWNEDDWREEAESGFKLFSALKKADR